MADDTTRRVVIIVEDLSGSEGPFDPTRMLEKFIYAYRNSKTCTPSDFTPEGLGWGITDPESWYTLEVKTTCPLHRVYS